MKKISYITPRLDVIKMEGLQLLANSITLGFDTTEEEVQTDEILSNRFEGPAGGLGWVDE